MAEKPLLRLVSDMAAMLKTTTYEPEEIARRKRENFDIVDEQGQTKPSANQ